MSARRLSILTFILAVASGATIANIFYSQPLLGLIGRSFGTGAVTASSGDGPPAGLAATASDPLPPLLGALVLLLAGAVVVGIRRRRAATT